MSRAVAGRPTPSREDLTLRETGGGKLVVTGHGEKFMAMLLRDNRLLAAIPFENAPSKIGAIYIGKVKNVVKNINACFVETTDGELCFLPLADCRAPFLINRCFDGRILEGDELVVQVVRDAVKTKQAAVTTKISLSGKYLAFSVGSRKTGISSKLEPVQKEALMTMLKDNGLVDNSGCLPEKNDLKNKEDEFLSVQIPPFGMILRTEAGKLSSDGHAAILEEYRQLYRQFTGLFHTALHRTCFTCLQDAAAPYQAAIEQFYPEEYSEVVTDVAFLYEELEHFFSSQTGNSRKPVRFYQDASYPLSKLYGIEAKLQDALSPRVWLKSGGYLVIEPTEALTVIDVNTGKFSGHKDIAETFYQINREAAAEIALQLRLRNLSGIIIADFINMDSSDKKEELLRYLRQLVKADRVRTDVIDMTALGLVEITRKKISRPLKDQL